MELLKFDGKNRQKSKIHFTGLKLFILSLITTACPQTSVSPIPVPANDNTIKLIDSITIPTNPSSVASVVPNVVKSPEAKQSEVTETGKTTEKVEIIGNNGNTIGKQNVIDVSKIDKGYYAMIDNYTETIKKGEKGFPQILSDKGITEMIVTYDVHAVINLPENAHMVTTTKMKLDSKEQVRSFIVDPKTTGDKIAIGRKIKSVSLFDDKNNDKGLLETDKEFIDNNIPQDGYVTKIIVKDDKNVELFRVDIQEIQKTALSTKSYENYQGKLYRITVANKENLKVYIMPEEVLRTNGISLQ